MDDGEGRTRYLEFRKGGIVLIEQMIYWKRLLSLWVIVLIMCLNTGTLPCYGLYHSQVREVLARLSALSALIGEQYCSGRVDLDALAQREKNEKPCCFPLIYNLTNAFLLFCKYFESQLFLTDLAYSTYSTSLPLIPTFDEKSS